jgi:hypothetical protein
MACRMVARPRRAHPCAQGLGRSANVGMGLVPYQALLGNPQNVARVRAMRPAVESVGGRLTLASPTKTGMVAVLIELPPGYHPDQFCPGIPFYPI